MKKTLKLLSFSFLFAFALSLPSVANTTKDLQINPRFRGSFTSEGAGYESQYFSIEGFVPLKTNADAITFFEGRLSWATDNTIGSNLLLGQRFIDRANQEILGAYLSYDVRGTEDNSFNQIGFGLERLGNNWDLRLNTYFPLGNSSQGVGDRVLTGTRFAGNSLLLDMERAHEVALSGVDVEAGGKIIQIGEGNLRGYGGVYYYGASGIKDGFGIRGRLEANPNQNMQLGLTLQHDPIFDTRLVFNFGLSWGGKYNQIPSEIWERVDDAIARNPMITIAETAIATTTAATNPDTGKAWLFRHVVPGVDNGDGSVENPVGTIQNALDMAVSEDVVYVGFGSGEENPGFTIPDGVSVLSTGVVQNLATQEFGNLQLPGSGSSNLPVIRGSVRLGNKTKLSGFAVVDASENGISAAAVENIIVSHNQIINSGGQGISLSGVGGDNLISNNTIENPGDAGIFLQSFNQQVPIFTVENNTVNDGGAQGLFAQASGDSWQQIDLRNNTFNRNIGAGVFLQANDTSRQDIQAENLSIQATQLDGNGDGGQGIFVSVNGTANQSLNLDNSQINQNAAQGLFAAANGGGEQRISVNNISANQNTGQGIFAQTNGIGSQQTLDFSQVEVTNTIKDINGDGGQGIFLAANSGSNQDGNIRNSVVRNNSAQGIFLATNDGASQRFEISETDAIQNQGQGLFLQANGGGIQEGIINQVNTNNTQLDDSGNGGQGLFISANSGATQQVDIDDLNSSNNAAQGVFISASGDIDTTPAQQSIDITNSIINSNNGQGIFIQANNNVRQEVGAIKNQISNTQNDGMGNGGQGIFVQANGAAQQQVDIQQNQIRNNQGQGVFVQANGEAQTTAYIGENTISNSGSNDIFLQANENAQLRSLVELNNLENQVIAALSANQNSNQPMCINLRQNQSQTGFLLQRNNGEFFVVNRDTLTLDNTGAVIFQPNRDRFTNTDGSPSTICLEP